LPPDALARRQRFVDQVIQSGEPVQFQDEHQGVWRETVLHPLCDKEGQVARIAVVSREITELWRIDETLWASEERYRDLVENINDVVYTIDGDGRVTYVSPAVKSFLGYEPLEVAGRHFAEFFHPEEVARLRSSFRELLTGQPTANEYRMLTKSGQTRWMRTSSRPVLEDNRVVAVQGVLADITERRVAGEALRQQAEELRLLQSILLDITVSRDLPALLETIVERAAKLLKASSGGLYLVEQDCQQVRLAVDFCIPGDFSGTVLSFGEGAAGTVARDGKPLLIEDYRTWSGRALAFEEEQPFRSVIAAPMIRQGEVTGVIDLMHDTEGSLFSEADLELLSLFANHAAIAVENARLYEQAQKEIAERKEAEAEAQRLLQETALLGRTTALVASADDLGEALHHVCAEVASYLQVPQAGFAILNAERTAAEVIADVSPPGSPSALGLVLPIAGNPSMAYVLEHQAPLAITDAQTDPILSPVHGVMRQRNVASILIVPIVSDGEVIGTLGFDSIQRRVFDESDIRVAQNVSSQVGQAVVRKRAEEAMEESEERYRSFVQHFQGIAYRANLSDWRPVFMHGAVKEITGYTADQLAAGQPSWDQIILPEDFAKIAEGAEMLRTVPNSATEREYRIVRQDGQIRWIYELTNNICDDSGQPVLIQGAIYDLSEHKRAEQQLEKSLREKEVLLREVHHRVKNNLQVISSLLGLQSEAVRNPELLQTLQDSQNRVRAMALIHEQLYQSPDLAEIDTADYVRDLVERLFGIYGSGMGRIRPSVKVADAALDLDRAIPCGLIINELVSNALQHAFPAEYGILPGEEAHVRVELAPEKAGQLLLVVADNGVGLPSDVGLENSSSLGLQLVELLTQQLGGTVELDRSSGTTFRIRF
jgi:PAS domain S-box-containing protein